MVTSQYVPLGPLRHPVIFINMAKTCRLGHLTLTRARDLK
jgi:hypothetical protein